MARSHKTQAREFALLALHAAEGVPITDRALRDHVLRGIGGALSDLDVGDVIRDLELDGLIDGTRSELRDDKVWLLSDTGAIRAKKLR